MQRVVEMEGWRGGGEEEEDRPQARERVERMRLLEFSVGAPLLSRMCSPCALTLNSMFAEYTLAFPHSRNRCLVKNK